MYNYSLRHRLLFFLVLAGFSLGYMEWGTDQRSIVFETQVLIFSEPAKMTSNFTHPIILAGLAGQLVLLAALLGFPIRRFWVGVALGLLAIPILLIFLAGVLSRNLAMVGSALPFLAGSLGLWWSLFRKRLS
jgi:hypothetical protein